MSQPLSLLYVTPLGLTITDGTVAGTQLVMADSAGFAPAGEFAAFGGYAVFPGASEGFNELWTSDGSAGGTSLITTLAADPAPGGAAGIGWLMPVGNNFVFEYQNGSNPGYGWSMWVSDGNASGTEQVPGELDTITNAGATAYLGNQLVFGLDTGNGVAELGITDGTIAGTQAFVPDNAAGFSIGNSMASLGSSVVFSAATTIPPNEWADEGNELWITNGTSAGTSLVVSFSSDDPVGGFVTDLTSIGTGLALFTLEGTTNTLWVTNGTAAGTNQLPGVTFPHLGISGYSAGGLSENGYVFTSSEGLDVSNGTAAGTKVLLPEVNGPNGFIPAQVMASLGKDVIFAASASGTLNAPGADTELWITDGTTSGTTLIATLPTNGGAASITSMLSLGDKVLFTYSDGVDPDAIWATDGTAAGTQLVEADADLILSSYTTAEIQVSCFAAGTRIRTIRGEMRVEAITIGDRVPVLLGDEPADVIWIGRREVICERHPQPELVWPVRVQAGAFGSAMPHTDLWLSPDHAIYVDEILIPVRLLMNGTSIAQMPVDRITYYHLELPQHDIVLAEGLAVETFLDTGDRAHFANVAGPVRLPPDFTARLWDGLGCAPLVVTGPKLGAARAMLNADAEPIAA